MNKKQDNQRAKEFLSCLGNGKSMIEIEQELYNINEYEERSIRERR